MLKKPVKPRKLPAQERSRDTVDVILEAAAHVFIEKGYAAGTTNHIAQKAGVSIGSLYQYFPNKDAILVNLAEQHLESAKDEIGEILLKAEADNASIFRLIRNIVGAMIRMHMQAPRLHQVIFEEAPLPDDLKHQLNTYEEAIAETLCQIIDQNLNVNTERPLLAARLIVRIVESLTHWYVIAAPEGVTEQDIIDEITTVISRYLRVK
jgi:AcrR family transcriptional regulator